MSRELIREFEVIPPLRDRRRGHHRCRRHSPRAPQVCLVDELARDNPPGSRYAHRWQEVEEIRAHGVNVVGAINLQHICEQQDAVERITGTALDEFGAAEASFNRPTKSSSWMSRRKN